MWACSLLYGCYIPAAAVACMCVCIFIKLHITAQSGPVILVILRHSHCPCSFVHGCYVTASFLGVRLALSPGCGALPLPPTLPTSPADCRLRALLSRSLSLFQRRRPIAVWWRSLDAHALCLVRPGVGRQPAPCLWLGLQQARRFGLGQARWLGLRQARWLGLRQARCGVVAVVYIPQEMRPLLARGWR